MAGKVEHAGEPCAAKSGPLISNSYSYNLDFATTVST